MKSQILSVKSALAGSQATVFTSNLIKCQDSRLWAYGGAFCLSVPYESSLECGFYPEEVLAFLSKDREGATFTEEDDFLVMKHGKVEHGTRRFAVNDIPSLQAVGSRHTVNEQIVHLDVAAFLSRNNAPDFTQAVWFKEGMIFAMQGRALCFSTNGFDFEHETFGLPSAAIQALSKIKSPMTEVVFDRVAVQFEFEDGTWLASRKLEGMNPPDFMKAFEGLDDPEVWRPLEFSKEAIEEIQALKLSGEHEGKTLDMLWEGRKGDLYFEAPKSEGVISEAYTGGVDFKINGESLRIVLAVETESTGIMLRNERPTTLNGYGENFAVAACLMR